MKKTYELIVLIGRFEPLHNPHLKVIKDILSRGGRILIILGSALRPRTIRNPWNVDERETMIRSALTDVENARVSFDFSRDYIYNDQRWAAGIQRSAAKLCSDNSKIALAGGAKNEFYIKMFPQWDKIEPICFEKLDATMIRTRYFGQYMDDANRAIKTLVPESVFEYLKTWRKTSEYLNLVGEYGYYKDLWEKFKDYPYKDTLTFVTSDCIVVQSGHILLIERANHPGKGLLAIPGGFVNRDETTKMAALRELKEETDIDCPMKILKGRIKDYRHFDAPGRSLRGRSITHTYLIQLPPGPLPKVKARDDAAHVDWFEISKIEGMSERFFEDHHDQLEYFTARL